MRGAAERVEDRLPELHRWIEMTLALNRDEEEPLLSFSFERLERFFEPDVLGSARVVRVDRVPFPPLSALGLPEFAELELSEFSGITFRDTYFLAPASWRDEAVHFHELVHVLQWRLLGDDEFIRRYALGFLERGYAASPFERIAFQLQERFERGVAPFSVADAVRRDLGLG